MSSTSLKREILGIALLLFAVFLVGAFASLALAQWRAGVSVEASVGWVGNRLARPLVAFFGWPAAVLIPLVPAVHAVRLFGRLESETDRSWMIFFAGMVALLPIALSLALPAPDPGVASLAGGVLSWTSREAMSLVTALRPGQRQGNPTWRDMDVHLEPLVDRLAPLWWACAAQPSRPPHVAPNVERVRSRARPTRARHVEREHELASPVERPVGLEPPLAPLRGQVRRGRRGSADEDHDRWIPVDAVVDPS